MASTVKYQAQCEILISPQPCRRSSSRRSDMALRCECAVLLLRFRSTANDFL